jgi:mannosyltransferase OCH1-like enzyme
VIPKKIHYCWFGPKPLPKLVINCLDTWKEQLKDYELNLWNEKNSPMKIPFVQQAYAAKRYAFISDYVRFWALYKYGGIYLDTDMFVIRSFNDLLKSEVFFGWETEQKNNISCGIIGSIPNQGFIRSVLKQYESMLFSVASIPDLVIPRVVNKCYSGYLSKEDITIFPYDYFYSFPYEEKENVRKFMQYRTENTYAIHLWNISWGTFKDKLRDRMLYHLRKLWRKAI